jgi:hydrocephalus-inducing protein
MPRGRHGKSTDQQHILGATLLHAVTFRPESTDNCSCELVVCTEREKFLVPITAHGAIMALDLPDYIHFPSAPTKLPTRRTLLVRNVGHKAAGFLMRAHAPFMVMPSEGFLEPGEVLQVGRRGLTAQQQPAYSFQVAGSVGRGCTIEG